MDEQLEGSIPVQQQLTGSTMQIGTCKYCGQTYQFETAGTVSEEWLNKWATEKCDCQDGKIEREKLKTLDRADGQIRQMIGSRDDGLVELMKNAVDLLLNFKMDSVTITVDECKFKLYYKTDKGIMINKTITKKDERKI